MSAFAFFLKLPLFKGVEPEALFSLIPKITLDFESYQEGEVLVNSKSAPKGVVFLLEGRAKGIREAGARVFASGSLISCSGLFGSGKKVSMNVIALEDSRILVIDVKSLIYLMQNNTTILTNYLDMLSDDLGR